MESLYLLIPLSIILVALALWIFFGAADSGQFDDLESPGWRILSDDDGVPPQPDSPEAERPSSLRRQAPDRSGAAATLAKLGPRLRGDDVE